jgi:hypothetical protein
MLTRRANRFKLVPKDRVWGMARLAIATALALLLTGSLSLAEDAKDQSRVNGDTQATPGDQTGSSDAADQPEGDEGDNMSLGEVPQVETIELTDALARKALDVYVLVKDKYKDAELENYENLQDFVDQNPKGKEFEADVKAAGFASVNDWNTAITTLGYAYSGTIDDQSADIKQQVGEITADTTIAQDMKDRMIASLNALIPSDNNKKVITALIADQAYNDKLKQLDVNGE